MLFDYQNALSIAERTIKLYTSVKTIRCSEEFTSEEAAGGNESFADYYKTGHTDELKKLLVVATKIYNKQNNIKEDPIQVASTIDDAIEVVKAAIDVATGKVDAEMVAQNLVDRVAVRAVCAADLAIEQGVPIVVDRLCAAIVSAYPPMAPAVPVIKMVANKMTTRLKTLVTKGITAAAKISKPFVARGLKSLRQQVQRISSKVESLAFA